jgi:hypothetical protein
VIKASKLGSFESCAMNLPTTNGLPSIDAAERAAWRSTGERPPCPQRHLLGVAVRRALAGPAGQFWSLHYLCYNRFARWRRVGVEDAKIANWSAETTAIFAGITAILSDDTSRRAHLTGRSSRFRRRDVRGCGEDSGGVAGSRLGGAVTRNAAHRRSPRSRRDCARRHQLILQFGPRV